MTSAMSSYTASGACPRPTRWAHPLRPDLPLKSRPRGRQRIPGDLFIHMDRLRVLSEIVEAGEAPRAVALEGALARVFADMAGQMFASSETQVAGREIGAEEALSFLLFRGWGITPQVLIPIRVLLSLGVLHGLV